MNEAEATVVVLDDQPSVRTALDRLLRSQGYRVRLHADPDSFFAAGPPNPPACLVLDNDLQHARTGIQVHQEILRLGWDLPTVFLTGHWQVQEVVSAIRSGADAFLTKPCDPADVLKSVAAALAHARAEQSNRTRNHDLRTRAAALTKREREIVCMVVSGKLNKQIAAELELALITVKVHRAAAMRKLGAGNAAELARMADQLGLCP